MQAARTSSRAVSSCCTGLGAPSCTVGIQRGLSGAAQDTTIGSCSPAAGTTTMPTPAAEARIAGARVMHAAADLAVAVADAHLAGQHPEHVHRLRLTGPAAGGRGNVQHLLVAGQHFGSAGALRRAFVGSGAQQQHVGAHPAGGGKHGVGGRPGGQQQQGQQ